MALKAIFPSDKESITVTGLYQWDYGQQLEIEAEGLPEVIEVHFSCTNMTEAIVRTCVRENGVYIAAIPDDCLEQATPITAWIYDFSVTQGKTVKVVTLPVVARTRPSAVREISADDEDRLEALITRLNQAIADLESGAIKVKSAESADTADTVSGFTGVVESADFAKQAGMAQKDYQGNVIHTTYEKKVGKLNNKSFNLTTIIRGTLLELGNLPTGKTVDDVVSIGLEVGLVTETFDGVLRFSAGKTRPSMFNPTTGRQEVPFSLTTSLISGETAFGTANMDVVIGSKDGKLYLYFENGSYSWYVINTTSGAFSVNQCDSEALNGGNFCLEYVYYWFA